MWTNITLKFCTIVTHIIVKENQSKYLKDPLISKICLTSELFEAQDIHALIIYYGDTKDGGIFCVFVFKFSEYSGQSQYEIFL